MKTPARKTWLNIVLFLAMIAINALGASGLINGMSQKDVTDRFPTLITPAPVAFSIGSVIYLLLAAGLVLTLTRQDDPYFARAAEKI